MKSRRTGMSGSKVSIVLSNPEDTALYKNLQFAIAALNT